jgi:hypothetical protein
MCTLQEQYHAERSRINRFIPKPGVEWPLVCKKHHLESTPDGNEDFNLTLPADWKVMGCQRDGCVSHYLNREGREVIRTFIKRTFYDELMYSVLEPSDVCKHCFPDHLSQWD